MIASRAPDARRTGRWLFAAAALLCAGFSLVSWLLYFDLYWPYRNLFNEQGRYFDESDWVVHHQQSNLLIVPALFFLLLALFFAMLSWSRRSRPP